MKIVGILPMAGKGLRLQPIPFSKELYPIVYKNRHFAISEFSIQAMLKAKVDEIKLVIHPDKLDIVKYYSKSPAPIGMYLHASASLPESCLFPINYLHDDDICLFGLPDTIFSPSTGYQKVLMILKKEADICLGVFKVQDASKYDSVKIGKHGNVEGVIVKKNPPLSSWIWGIWGANVKTLKLLKNEIKTQKMKNEKLLGVGFNSLAKKKVVKMKAVKIGKQYFDVGTMEEVIEINSKLEKFNLPL